MLRLFKEVFKSLSKNKIIMIGLSILIFLSSGVFTLVSNVRNNYDNEFEKYKNQSVLHDASIDLNVNFLGKAENNGFDQENFDNLEARTYFPVSNATEVVGSLEIPKNIEYISLKSLGAPYPNSENIFIKASALNSEYLRNNNQQLDAAKSTIFDLEQNTFKPNISGGINFDLYTRSHSGNYEPVRIESELNVGDVIALDRIYNLNDIAKINRGENQLGLQIGDDYLTNISNLYINIATKEATFDFVKSKIWEERGALVSISGNEVAKLMNFEESVDFNDRFYLNKEKALTEPSWLFLTNVKKVDNLNSIWGQTYINKVTLNENAQSIQKALNTYALTTPIRKKVNQSYNFSKGLTYHLNSEWTTQTKRTVFFVQNNYLLNYSEEKNNWTGVYKKYIEQIKKNDPETFQALQKFSYWEKNIEYKISNGKTAVVKQSLTNQDLKTKIALKNGARTSIQKIENLSNSDVEDANILAKFDNANIKDETFSKIKKAATEMAKIEIINEIKKPDYKISDIGIRQTITAKSVNEKSGESQVYQFINAGNDKQEVLGQKQKVGKLFEESAKASGNSQLFTSASKVEHRFIDSIYVTKIVDSIFKGFLPDENYLKANIRYVNYTTYNSRTNIPLHENLAKIVVLSSLETEENNYAIAEKNGKYRILQRSLGSQKDDWNIFYIDKEFEFDLTQIHKWVTEQKLTIDGKIGKTWLRQDDVYKNLSFLPLEYFVPKKNLLKQVQENNSLEVMFRNISNFLVNSPLVVEGFISEEDILKLFVSVRQAMEANNFQNIFKQGKIINAELQKTLFEALYLANEQNGPQFIKSIIVKFANNVKNKVLYKDFSAKKERSIEEQKDYFKVEATKLITFAKQFMGLDILAAINEALSLTNVINYIKSPTEFIDAIVNLIESVDFNSFIKGINGWYQTKWNRQDNVENYYSLSLSEVLVYFLENIDSKKSKIALADLINAIDFNAMLNPTIPNSLFNNYTKNIDNQLRDELKNIFQKLNNKENPTPYYNVATSLKDLIALVDFRFLTKSLRDNMESVYFLDKKTTTTGAVQEVSFVAKVILARDLYATLIKSISGNSNFSKVEDILVKLLNLSGKVSDLFILLAPSFDPDKLDISALTILSQFSALSWKNMKNTFATLQEKFESNAKLDDTDLEFIRNYLPTLSRADLESREKISQALIYFNSLFKKIGPYAYLNNSYSDPDKWHLSFNINSGRERTLGDFLVEFKNSIIGGNESSVLNIAKKAANGQLKGFNSPEVVETEAITIFGIWLKFAAENPELSSTQIHDIITKFFALVQNDSELYQLLNDPILKNNFYTESTLNNSTTKELQVTRGQVLVRELTQQLWRVESDVQGNAIFSNKQIAQLLAKEPFNKKVRNWMLDNKESITAYLGLLAAGIKNKNNFESLSKNFVNYAFGNSSNAFTPNEIALAYNLLQRSKVSSEILSFLGIPQTLNSSYLPASFPEIALWTTTNPNNVSSDGNGNLAFIVRNRIYDFSKLSKSQIADSLSPLLGNSYIAYKVLSNEETPVSFDLSWLNWLKERAFVNPEGKQIEIFGVQLEGIIFGILDSILEKTFQNRIVLINDNRSYVAKISESFATKNGKAIYDGPIPNNSIEIEQLLDTIDEKYYINAGGVKFLIIGYDAVVDYIYPVIDEENLQVNTQNQALAFVNQQGFDRISNSFRGNAIKEYVLAKMLPGEDHADSVSKIDNYISSNFSSTTAKKAFLVEELDPINPERALRVSVVSGIISLINQFNIWVTIILALLVALSVLFIIKRYISVRGKVLGILRAQGYNSLEIGSSFTIFALVATGVGGSLGYGFGILSQKSLMDVFASYWTIPTPITAFNWLHLIITIFVPFVMMSSVIIFASLWVLRKKPIHLMSGIVDISIGNVARIAVKPFSKMGVKTKFIASLGINSFWKLIVLMISTILTSFAMIFSISSFGVLDKSVDSTYANRNYKYKLNLLTPTTEGGGFNTYSKDDLENLLYTPIGDSSEAQSWKSNFFQPGWALINGIENSDKFPNGIPGPRATHVVTKSSVDIAVNQGGLSISPWEIVLNSMPDSQKARTLQLSSKATKALEETQNLKTTADGEVYLGEDNSRLDYFAYDSKVNKFVYMKWDEAAKYYVPQEITTSRHRDEYRKFLVAAYKKININDFFIAFAGVLFNQSANEKYSHAIATYDNKTIGINGYKQNSDFVKIFSGKQNLLNSLEKYPVDADTYPLIINEVVAKKYSLKIGAKIEINVENHLNRNLNKLQNVKSETNHKFEIIGINDTYINEEWTTSQKIINQITGLDKLPPEQQFNGILSQEKIPTQLLESAGIYAPGGYWAATDLIDVDANSVEENLQYFEEIFGDEGILSRNGINLAQRRALIGPGAETLDLSKQAMGSENYANKNATLVRQSLNKYIDVYGANLYSPIATSISSKDIEISFINNISQTINYISTALIIFFFLISMIILIMISSMMISENEKNISIFAILGYTTREKILLFFTIYVPVIVLATLIATPFVIGFVALFNSLLVSTSSIAIPLVISWWHIILSMSFTFILFTVTSVFAWISLNKIKAIHLLKGK